MKPNKSATGFDPAKPPDSGRMDITGRVRAVLQGRKTDRIPFISRMDFWHLGLAYQEQLPTVDRGKSLSEIHRTIGFG
jgi:hypothetical protein